MVPDFELEAAEQEADRNNGITCSYVAGCDEAGRGPFAGPLVAAAVILPKNVSLPGITDSKKVPKNKHREYARQIVNNAIAVGVGVASVEYIDRFGIGAANRYAIEEAVKSLSVKPTRLLIDGSAQQEIQTDLPQKQVVKGDQKSLSIAAASIVAKSIHDELLWECAAEFPEYNWGKNAGYGTPDHIAAIRKYGVCKHHRRSFKPIKNYLKEKGAIIR